MAAFNGFALGAIADSRRETLAASQQGRALNLKEKAIDNQDDQAKAAATAAAETAKLKRLDDIKKGATAGVEAIRQAVVSGKPPESMESIRQITQTQINSLEDPAVIARLNKALEAALATQSTVVSDAQNAGKGEAAGAVAKRDALTGAGVDPATAANSSGLTAPTAVQPPNIVRLQQAEKAAREAGKLDEANEIAAQIKKIGTITGRTEQDVAGSTVGTTGDKTALRNLGEGFRGASSNIREIELSLDKMRETPDSVGIPGFIEENIGGLIRQIPVLSDAAIEIDAIKSPEEAKKIASARSQASAVALNLVQTVIDEPRVSDQERARAEKLSRQLEAGADFPVIEEALKTTLEFFKRRATDNGVQIMFESGLKPADLQTEEGAQKLVDQFMRQGLSEDRAIDQLILVRTRVGG